MDELLKIFLTWQFLFACLGLAAITFVIRKVFEYIMLKNHKDSTLWRSVILPVLPVVNGTLIGFFAKNYPYPETLGTSVYGRLSFGLVAGLLSGLVYRVVVELLSSYVAAKSGNTAAPPITDTLVQSVKDSINHKECDPDPSAPPQS